MRRKFFVLLSQFLVLFLVGSRAAYAVDWRFPVGLTYLSGFGDVVDQYEDNLEAEGFSTDTDFYNPVGVSFHPYVEFDSGVGIGAGLGPVMAIISSEANFISVPISLDVRFSLFPEANTSPYVRAGARYNIAGGEYVESSKPGFLGGVGIEFLRNSIVGIGIEVSYDSSEIELEDLQNGDTEDIKPGGLLVSLFVIL